MTSDFRYFLNSKKKNFVATRSPKKERWWLVVPMTANQGSCHPKSQIWPKCCTEIITQMPSWVNWETKLEFSTSPHRHLLAMVFCARILRKHLNKKDCCFQVSVYILYIYIYIYMYVYVYIYDMYHSNHDCRYKL